MIFIPFPHKKKQNKISSFNQFKSHSIICSSNTCHMDKNPPQIPHHSLQSNHLFAL